VRAAPGTFEPYGACVTDFGSVLAPAAALGGVFVGLYVTGQREDKRWRRDRRTDAYAAVLAAAGDLQTTLTRGAHLGDFSGYGPIDFDDVLKMTAVLRSAVALADLHAGAATRRAMSLLVGRIFEIVDGTPADWDTGAIDEALIALQAQMRSDLQLK
jgi:hypothetical protein